jgi:hypothetical protein
MRMMTVEHSEEGVGEFSVERQRSWRRRYPKDGVRWSLDWQSLEWFSPDYDGIQEAPSLSRDHTEESNDQKTLSIMPCR